MSNKNKFARAVDLLHFMADKYMEEDPSASIDAVFDNLKIVVFDTPFNDKIHAEALKSYLRRSNGKR